MFSKKCESCGILMYRKKKSEAIRKNWKYCSMRCRGLSQNLVYKDYDYIKKCLYCNKEILVRKSLISRSCFSKKYNKNIHPEKTRFCSKNCNLCFRNKYENPASTISGRKKLSEFATKRGVAHMKTPLAIKKLAASIRGDRSHRWQGGKTDVKFLIRNMHEMVLWKKQVTERDNYTCVMCNSADNKLEVDHIKQYALILKENNIRSIDDALKCDELWDINNGRTLCTTCHRSTYKFNKRNIYK